MTDADLAEQFARAPTGAGTRKLSAQEALSLLAYVKDRGWFFQSMEAWSVTADRETPELDHGILGLRYTEHDATPEQMNSLAEELLSEAAVSDTRFIFQVWIDTAEPTDA